MPRVVVLVVVLLVAVPPPAVAVPAVRYAPPVPGAVTAAFDDPDHAYAAGHRGVDLDARPGAPVRAAASGRVTFAGAVGGQRWVTVAHPDGVRTSYGAVTDLRVATGDEVALGAVVATAVGHHTDGSMVRRAGLHWSARRGETYLDPTGLLGATLRPTLVGPGGWRGTDPVVDAYDPYPGGSHWLVMAPPSPDVEHRGYALPPNHHHLVQVPGYATEGPTPVLEPELLGYDAAGSSTMSYGGCAPVGDGCLPRPYGGTDTDVPIELAAELLEAHLRGRQRVQPGRPVDLLGHSLGGDVAAHYLEHRHDPGDPELPPIGSLVTMATPHGGSGLAFAARAVDAQALVSNPLEAGRRALVGDTPVGRTVVGRVSTGSEVVQRYGGLFGRGLPDRRPGRLEELGVEVLEIAGSRDLVVSREDAGGFGAAAVLPGGHHSLPRKEATYQAVHDFLAGRPVTAADGSAGWATEEVADATRWAGVAIDVLGARGLARSLVRRDLGGVGREAGKAALPGSLRPLRPSEDDLRRERLGPWPPSG